MRSCYSKYINTYWLGSILLLQIGLNVFLEFKLTRSSEEKKIFKKEISSGGNKTSCWSLDAHPHFDFNCLVRKVPNGAHKCPKIERNCFMSSVHQLLAWVLDSPGDGILCLPLNKLMPSITLNFDFWSGHESSKLHDSLPLFLKSDFRAPLLSITVNFDQPFQFF